MEKSGHISDELRLKIVSQELAAFERLIAGHRKLLWAIGEL